MKKYGLRPLAVTADNGLLAPIALKNMKKVVDRLGVDHLVVTRNKEELRSLYRAFFRKTKNFCEVCYLTILSSLGQAAVEHDVPLIITGAAFKVDSSHFRAGYRYCVEDAVINIVKDSIQAEVYSKYISKEAFLTKNLDSPKLVKPLVSEKDFDVLREYRERPGISERNLIEKLFEIIRPELKRDGGDIKILEYKDKVLRIELLGGCRACYMADVIMMRYLEHLVRTHISEDIIIENVKKLV